MDPSGGGEPASEDSKADKSRAAAMAAKCEKVDTPNPNKELKGAFSSAAVEEEIPLYPDRFDGFTELPVKSLKSDESLEIPLYPDSFDGFTELPVKSDESQKGDESLQIPLYPDSFHGFTELPVKSDESLKADHSLEIPLYPDRFDGFTELPVKSDESLEIPLYPDSFEGFAELPVSQTNEWQQNVKAWSKSSDEVLNGENNNSKTNNLKRTIGDDDDDKSQLGSPKRLKDSANKMPTSDNPSLDGMALLSDEFDNCEEILNDIEDNISKIDRMKRNSCEDDGIDLGSPKRAKTIVIAESPLERFRLLNAFRRLAQSHNKRGATLEKREATLDKREATLDKREATLDKRECSVDKRESSMDKRVFQADSKESLLQKVKSDDEPTKQISVAVNIDKAKAMVEKAASYFTLVDTIMNIPTKSKEMVMNSAIAQEYIKKQNEDIVKKLKGYVGGMTTAGVANYAKEILVESVKEVLGGEINNGGEVSDAEAGGPPTETQAVSDTVAGASETGAGGPATETQAVSDTVAGASETEAGGPPTETQAVSDTVAGASETEAGGPATETQAVSDTVAGASETEAGGPLAETQAVSDTVAGASETEAGGPATETLAVSDTVAGSVREAEPRAGSARESGREANS